MVRLPVHCPACGKIVTSPAAANAALPAPNQPPYFPFCSQRCKLLDLGAWADQRYTIPGKPVEKEDEFSD